MGKKIKRNELEVLRQVRMDARKTFTDISKDTGIPLTTAYENYHRVKKKHILKEIALLDYDSLGLARMILIAENNDEELVKYLKHEPVVNNLDFLEDNILLAELIIPPSDELRYIEILKNFRTENIKFITVKSSIKKECFIPD